MVTGVLFPIIVMPYINKTLNPLNIGKIEYATSIVNYFILFTTLGIPIYGVREISKLRNEKEKLNVIFLEFVVILIFTNIISYLIYFLLICKLPNFSNHKEIFFVMMFNILFSSFGVEWFYQGIEEQKYITIRAVIVRIISMVLIFIFINKEQDYLKYAGILSLGIVGGNIFNLYYLKNYIVISKNIIKKIKPLRHLKYILITFVSSLAVTIYTQMDIIMLGNMVGMEYVGLYSLPIKFLRLATAVVILFGSTLLPRVTYLYEKGDNEKYKNYLVNSFSLLLMYSFFATVVLFVFSKDIVYIFGGELFEKSIITMKILSITVIFSGIAYFTGVIILYSQKKDKIFLWSVIIAAFINLILNYFLIPISFHNGAALATLIAEVAVMVAIQIFAYQEIKNLNLLNKNNIKFLFSGMGVLLFEKIIIFEFSNIYINLFLKFMILATLYLSFLLILKEKTCIEYINSRKIRKNTINN